MSWTHTVSLDADKTNVGTISSTFTDTDGTTFPYSQRIQATQAALNAFVSAAVAARNAWQTLKGTEATDLTAVKNAFTTAGETNA